jgi:hypothetical protein
MSGAQSTAQASTPVPSAAGTPQPQQATTPAGASTPVAGTSRSGGGADADLTFAPRVDPKQLAALTKHHSVDSDDDSNASSLGHDVETGQPVFRNYREEMRYKRRMERLAEAKGLPRGVPYRPPTVIEEAPPEAREETAASRAVAERPRVTPYNPVNDPQSRRDRTLAAIEAARERVADRNQTAPRMVRDPTYGYLLPRDSVVNITRPLRMRDENGEEVVVAPPAVGFAADNRFVAQEAEKAVEDGTRVHYRRTVDVLQATRQNRIMRSLNLM